MKLRSLVQISGLLAVGITAAPYALPAQDVTTENVSESTTAVSKEELEAAVARVKPSLVRIKVVEPNYYDGRESKFVSFGSGTIISADGYIVTNHHVAGKAVYLEVTMPNREKISAELIGTDPATDIAVIKLKPEQPTTFPFAEFGNSDDVKVGDAVLALGSPMALSQSVTLGIVANTEMITPESFGDYTFTLDGENVGELVRWIGHDAAIFPGNSGGPLIDLQGKIIGVNEIGMALGGAIPGNLAKQVVDQIIKGGTVRRAYIGTSFQPLLKNSEKREGVLVNTVLKGSPAEKAGVKPGDVLMSINGTNIQGRFAEDLPGINQLVANLEIGKEAALDVVRDGQRQTIKVTPELRKPAFIPETELREWGASVRDVSMWTALELAREKAHGVLITSM